MMGALFHNQCRLLLDTHRIMTTAVRAGDIWCVIPPCRNICRLASVCRNRKPMFLMKFWNPSSAANCCWQGITFSTSAPRKIDPDVERLQKSWKGIVASPKNYAPDKDRIIYELKAINYVHFVAASFYVSALGGLYMAPDIIVSAWESDITQYVTILNYAMLFVGIVVLPVLFRNFTRRLVFKMFYNESKDTYLAVVPRIIFGTTTRRFKGSEVVGTKSSSFQRIFRVTTFSVNRRPYLVYSGHFRQPSDYNKLMGFV